MMSFEALKCERQARVTLEVLQGRGFKIGYGSVQSV